MLWKKKRLLPALTLSLALVLSACGEPAAPSSTPDAPPSDPPAAPTQSQAVAPAAFEDGIEWDGEYDVITVGFGAAGAATAITAADTGASVLLLEKAPEGEEGGNSRYAAQIVLCPTDREKAITYFEAMRGGYDNLSDSMIETIVDGAMATGEWVTQLGAPSLKEYKLVEYPELEGSDGITCFVIDGEVMTSRLWQLLRSNVTERDKIDVWFNSPGVKLIQDPETKIIHGVVVERDGQLLNIRARNGVVLTCGGFEGNEDMVENYTQMPYAYSKGGSFNTGDGIRMAMDVGADLWHMSALSGPDYNFKSPEKEIVYGYTITAKESLAIGDSGFVNNGVITVGGDGTRFTDEATRTRHGHVDNSGTWVSLQIPTPCYMIFDEHARLDKPMYPSWSEGNEEELAKGWLVQADTIAELAEKIGLDPAALEKTVKDYNGYCATGVDIEHGRPAEYLKPIGEGPYYAVEMSPSFTNTQGGPRRDEKGQILDVWGQPIPHLYSAGELGSVYPDIYNGGGNLSECIFFGRISGENAAAPKDDVSPKSVMEGRTPTVTGSDGGPDVALAADEVLGKGVGMGGDLYVKVKLDGDAIVSVEVAQHNETPGVSDSALKEVPAAIVAANSTDVDTVSGATLTSKAIISAVNDALSK